jgi:hypothetical protein
VNAPARKPLHIALAAIMGIGVLLANENLPQIKTGALVSKAEAIIGRPLTPMSYAAWRGARPDAHTPMAPRASMARPSMARRLSTGAPMRRVAIKWSAPMGKCTQGAHNQRLTVNRSVTFNLVRRLSTQAMKGGVE